MILRIAFLQKLLLARSVGQLLASVVIGLNSYFSIDFFTRHLKTALIS